MIETKVIKKYIQTLPIKDAIVRTDHLVESIQFEMTNLLEGLDFSNPNWQWFVYYKTSIDDSAVSPLEVSYNEDKSQVFLTWKIDHTFTKRSGLLDFQIRGKLDSPEGLIKWNSIVASINIGQALDPDNNDTDENILEWYLDRMEQLAQSGSVGVIDERDRAMAAEKEISDNLQAEIERSTSVDNSLQEQITKGIYETDKQFTSLRSALSEEIRRSTKTDNALRESINEETLRAENKERDLDEKIDAETARALQAEKDLETSSDTKLKAEVERATAAESALDTKINEETERAKSEETSIRSEMSSKEDSLNKRIDEEIARAEGSEKTLRTDLNSEIARAKSEENRIETGLNSALQTETERATAEESRLDSKIEAETNRARKEEEAIRKDTNDSIDNLANELIAEAKRLDDKIVAETDRATTREDELETNFNKALQSETDRATARENEIETNLTNALQKETDRATLAENTEKKRAEGQEAAIRSEMAQEVETLNNTIESNVNTLNATIQAEEQRATKAETDLNNLLNEEVERAKGAESTLDANLTKAINDESARAQKAEETLSSGLKAETSRATLAEKNLLDSLNEEVSRATTSEQALDNKIDTETTRATAAEKVLRDSLAEEVERAKGAEQSVANDLTSEVTRAKNAETNLSNTISAEITRATGREMELEDAIGDETTRATLAEKNLQNNLNTAKVTLETSISNEVSRAKTAEKELQEGLNTTNSTLQEEITRSTEADEAMNNRVNILEEGMNSRIAQLIANLNEETARSIAKDRDHDNSITEITRNLATTTANLQKEIDRSTEIDTRVTAEIGSLTITKIEQPSSNVTARYNLQLTRDGAPIVRGVNIDIPATDAITGGRFDDETKELVLVLSLGGEIRVPIGDLIQYYGAGDGLELIRIDNTQNKFAVKLDKATGTQGILSTSEAGLRINLTNYFTKGEIDTSLATKQPTLRMQEAKPEDPYTPSVVIDESNTIFVNSRVLSELKVAYSLANQNQTNLLQLATTTVNGFPISDEDTGGGLIRKSIILYDGTPVDGNVLIASGTAGKYKDSGFTIKTSVPKDAVFTDTLYYPTTEANPEGLFTREEQIKLAGIAEGAEVNVQSDWNAVDGDAFIKNKPSLADHSANGFMSSEDKIKLDGIAPKAEVNQNSFSKIIVGSSSIEAVAKTDSFTIQGKSGTTVTVNGKVITISSPELVKSNWNETNSASPAFIENKPVDATTTKSGFMSKEDKAKLEGVQAKAEVNQNSFSEIVVGSKSYTAKAKTDSFTVSGLGATVVAVTEDGLSISSPEGVQSDWGVTDSTSLAFIKNKPVDATTTKSGFMSSTDKAKLDGIASKAEVNQNAFSNIKVGAVTTPASAKTDTFEIKGSGAVTVTLSGKVITLSAPVIGQSDWNETDDSSSAFIKNKPTNATTTVDGFMSKGDKAKLNGVQTGAEVNQNAFSGILVGGKTLSATAKTDSFEIEGAGGTTVTFTGKKITINSKQTDQPDWNVTDTASPSYIKNKPVNATTAKDGFMSKGDKAKLDSVATTYLPLAGGTLTGNVNTKSVLPSTYGVDYLGSDVKRYKAAYFLDGVNLGPKGAEGETPVQRGIFYNPTTQGFDFVC